MTSTRRRINDFVGFGNVTAVEIGGGLFLVAFGGMILPDGTSLGPNLTNAPAIAVGPTAFSVLAYWWLRWDDVI